MFLWQSWQRIAFGGSWLSHQPDPDDLHFLSHIAASNLHPIFHTFSISEAKAHFLYALWAHMPIEFSTLVIWVIWATSRAATLRSFPFRGLINKITNVAGVSISDTENTMPPIDSVNYDTIRRSASHVVRWVAPQSRRQTANHPTLMERRLFSPPP